MLILLFLLFSMLPSVSGHSAHIDFKSNEQIIELNSDALVSAMLDNTAEMTVESLDDYGRLMVFVDRIKQTEINHGRHSSNVYLLASLTAVELYIKLVESVRPNPKPRFNFEVSLKDLDIISKQSTSENNKRRSDYAIKWIKSNASAASGNIICSPRGLHAPKCLATRNRLQKRLEAQKKGNDALGASINETATIVKIEANKIPESAASPKKALGNVKKKQPAARKNPPAPKPREDKSPKDSPSPNLVPKNSDRTLPESAHVEAEEMQNEGETKNLSPKKEACRENVINPFNDADAPREPNFNQAINLSIISPVSVDNVHLKVELKVELDEVIKKMFSYLSLVGSKNNYLVGSQVLELILTQHYKSKTFKANDHDFVTFDSTKRDLLTTPNDRQNGCRMCQHNSCLYFTSMGGIKMEIFSVDEKNYKPDFTIAALRISKDGLVFDPTSKGLNDLENMVIRTVNENAKEVIAADPITILRALKYTLMGFKMDDTLESAIREWNGEIKEPEHFNNVFYKEALRFGENWFSLMQEYRIAYKPF